MKSTFYAERDFSDVCVTGVVAHAANPTVAEYMSVPERAGGIVTAVAMPPAEATVRLFLDLSCKPRQTQPSVSLQCDSMEPHSCFLSSSHPRRNARAKAILSENGRENARIDDTGQVKEADTIPWDLSSPPRTAKAQVERIPWLLRAWQRLPHLPRTIDLGVFRQKKATTCRRET